DRKVYSTLRREEKQWPAWAAVGDAKFAGNTRITPFHQSSGRTDLFAVGKDGKVCSTFREQGKDWQKWRDIGEGSYDAFSGLTAVAHPKAAGRLDLFAVGRDRRVYATFREEGQPWQNWAAVHSMQFVDRTRVAAVSEVYAYGGIGLFAVGPFGAERRVHSAVS